MKYRVIWDDWEDGRTGIDWDVEASSLGEAYCKAVDELEEYACKFVGSDLEALVDENGKHYWPQFFLEDSDIKNQIRDYELRKKEDVAEKKESNGDKRLIVISGPSGVGKGPIIEWLKKLYCPDLCQVNVKRLQKTCRDKSSEKVYDCENFQPGFNREKMTLDFLCRGHPQRLDLNELNQNLYEHKTVLVEAYYLAYSSLKDIYSPELDFKSVFISPLSQFEIGQLKSEKKFESYLERLMHNSLLHRAVEVDSLVVTPELSSELLLRAKDAAQEIDYFEHCPYFIPNHCYEADVRWRLDKDRLFGEPKETVDKLWKIINS